MADQPITERPAPQRDGFLAAAVAGLVLLTVAIGALAPAPDSPAPRSQAQAPLEPEDDPACAEWSDGCHVCRREPGGAACSLPGIACTPGAFTCTRRTAGP